MCAVLVPLFYGGRYVLLRRKLGSSLHANFILMAACEVVESLAS